MDIKQNRPATSAKCDKAKKNEQANFSTSNESQRQRILEWLLVHHTLTTFEAREFLKVMHPSGRVKELKARGHHIETERINIDTGKSVHKGVARYVLLTEAGND